MTEPMLIVLGILAGAIALWSWGRPRADIVAVLIVLALLLARVLTPQESFAGFGDPIVILIAAVFVVGAALESTGGLLSRQQTVEVAKTRAPRAGDLLDYYGLTSWWHRLQVSCSASFVTPVSSTWNLLVMEPGGYSFWDYVKIGTPLLLLTMLITVTLVRLIYHF